MLDSLFLGEIKEGTDRSGCSLEANVGSVLAFSTVDGFKGLVTSCLNSDSSTGSGIAVQRIEVRKSRNDPKLLGACQN